MSRTHFTQTPSYSYTHVQKRRHTKTPMDTLTRTKTTLRCLARVHTRPGAPACYFSGSQPSPLWLWGKAAPRLPPLPPCSAPCLPKNGESERAGHERVESWELDAWIAGLRDTGPGCQRELEGRAHRIWTAAYSQVQGKMRPGSSQGAALLPASVQSNRFFLPLGWRRGGGAQGRAAFPSSPPGSH